MLHGILLSQIQSICDTYAGISGYKMLHGILLSQIPVYICHSPWDLTLQNAAWHITITDSVYMWHIRWDLTLQNAAWHIIITDSSLYVTHTLGSHATKCCMAYYYHRFQSTFVTHLGISCYKIRNHSLGAQKPVRQLWSIFADFNHVKFFLQIKFL